jgi:hypothetical protein
MSVLRNACPVVRERRMDNARYAASGCASIPVARIYSAGQQRVPEKATSRWNAFVVTKEDRV